MTGIVTRGLVTFGTDGDDIFELASDDENGRFIGGDGIDVLLVDGDSTAFTGGSGWIESLSGITYARYFEVEILRFDDRDVAVADLPDGAGVTIVGDQNPDQLADEIEYTERGNIWIDSGRGADEVIHDLLGAGALVAKLGRGADRLESDAWAATVHAGRGDDVVDLHSVTEYTAEVYGGGGDDVLRIGGDYALVKGGAGDDLFEAAGMLKGGRGDDTFRSWWTLDGSTIDGGAGVDKVVASVVPDDYELIYDDIGALTYITTFTYDEYEFDDVSTFVFTDIEIFVDSSGERHRVDGRPIGLDDTFKTAYEESRTVDVAKLLANDAYLADLGIEFVKVKNAEHGTVELIDDEVVFTPEEGFSGRAGFDYIIRNEIGRDKVHVTVRVQDAEPDPDGPWPYDDDPGLL
ncbi:Ig-like domain-containing protein [Albimonas sp. CAU 1670]|uniref:Ig-like domain-containing protein n=1 Tax=Albimonas sp. CAU 1670 TaxID=3032599 RepID=UPI0023DC9930|nr:Ig-like domain-containing protein [Albimonas sp. CAU 1670]MDF2232941.1 Ig-like domain-containing protein [Albimonas sp. CAU 1670]